MALLGSRTFVGFGFGAIQAGLFLYEAFRSGAFRRLVVGEVLPHVVEAVRDAGGYYSVNIAHSDHVEVAQVGPVEIENPASGPDIQVLVEAVAEAEEIATAVPSVHDYVTAGPGSLHRILANGLREKAARRGPRTVVYAAENHNQAAEILEESVLGEIPRAERPSVGSRVRFLNTVIGKMSGTVVDSEEVRSQGLATITARDCRAFLVEAFNRIQISRIRFEEAGGKLPFRRGISVFQEKDDLLPFEEAKLYGHNATHALAAYVSAQRGLQRIAELREFPDILRFLRAAFIQESGGALIRKHSGKDRLFTAEGYRIYADDLLERMTNPYLRDSVERVGRDPQRKLGWNDRLVGTMRTALAQDLAPRRYAFGAAAALTWLDHAFLETEKAAVEWLEPIWGNMASEPQEKRTVLGLIEEGRRLLKRWRRSGFQDLEELLLNAA